MLNRIILAFVFLCSFMAEAQVSVAPFTTAQVQFFDASGLACAGCQLSTFSAGTTTPLATYSDLGVSLQSNPIILDSAGVATIFLTSASYKFVLKKSVALGGATIRTVDNISWNTPLTTFAGLTDAGNLTQTQPTAATGGANQSSFSDCMNATYWTGSVSATDSWCLQDIVGTGTNPTSTFTLTHSGSSGAAAFSIPGNVSVGGTLGVTGATTLSSLNTIQMADQATGTDWCAKTLAALAANNEAFVNQNSTPGSCTTNITMPSGSVIHFIQAGHYVLSTFNIIPGTNTNVVCDTRGVVIDYSGTGAAWDDNTVTGAETNGCTWNALTSSPVALLRVRNTGNSFNMNVRVRAKLSATTYSAGQIGLLLQGDGATSANYRSTYDVETDTLDIGGRNVSLVNNQSPNGNIGVIKCSGHTVCLDAMDMTDSMWTVLALGAHTAGTAIRLCATGNGGSGVSGDAFKVSSEQGGASTTVSVASASGLSVGCGNSLIYGQTNDATQYSDVNAPRTNLVVFNTGLLANNRLISTSNTFTVTKNDNTLPATISNDTAGGINLTTNGGKVWNMLNSGGMVTPAGLGIDFNEGSQAGTASGFDICYGDSTAHALKCSYNNGSFLQVPQVIASGTSTFTTTAVTAGTCQTTVTTVATGAATTDAIEVAFATAPVAATDGMLTLQKYVTSGNVNFMRCNPTAGSITPTALVLNWRVVR